MKQYGSCKATEFTKKQINLIYGKAKSGELKVESGSSTSYTTSPTTTVTTITEAWNATKEL